MKKISKNTSESVRIKISNFKLETRKDMFEI
jgi:hypothetical protein